jgi:YD repeat-containing protein
MRAKFTRLAVLAGAGAAFVAPVEASLPSLEVENWYGRMLWVAETPQQAARELASMTQADWLWVTDMYYKDHHADGPDSAHPSSGAMSSVGCGGPCQDPCDDDKKDSPPNEKNDSDDDPDDDVAPDGQEDEGDTVASSVSTSNPIYYTGAIGESPVDFRLPSDGGIYWMHQRFYNQYAGTDALRIYYAYDSNDPWGDSTEATVRVTDNQLILETTGGTNPGTDSLTFSDADKDTLTELVTAINALSRSWTATLVAAGSTSSTSLLAAPGQNAHGLANIRTLYAPGEPLTEQGYNWTYSYWWHLERDPGNSNVIYYRRDAYRRYRYNFTSVSDGTFMWENDMRIRSRLVHNHALDPTNTYRLQKPNGVIWLFYDFNEAWGNRAGKLWKVIGLYGDVTQSGQTVTVRGNVLEVFYDSNNSYRLDYIVDPSGHYIRYSYVSGGALDGMLNLINVWQDGSTNDNTKRIARITFTHWYVDNPDVIHDDCGSLKDLIQVKVETRATYDPDDNLDIERLDHYRYYKGDSYPGGAPQGKKHQLRMILRSDAVRRALEDVNISNVLSVANDTINDYASSLFEYYDASDSAKEGRVYKEDVHSGANCCGGSSDPGIYTYDYALTTAQAPDRNTWALQTTETRPDGSTQYVDTNALGETVLVALYEDAGYTMGRLQRVHQYGRDTTSGRINRIYMPAAILQYDPATHEIIYDEGGLVHFMKYEDASLLYRHRLTKRYTRFQVGGPGASDPSSEQGDMLVLKAWETAGDNWGYRTTVRLDKSYRYFSLTSNETGTGGVVVQDWSYAYWPDLDDVDNDENTTEDTDRVKTTTATFPKVSNSENGPGDQAGDPAPVARYFYDKQGDLRWVRDPDGRTVYFSYDTRNGRAGLQVVDPYVASTYGSVAPAEIRSPSDGNIKAWTSTDHDSLPSSFYSAGNSADHVQLVDKESFDTRGRVRSATKPDGQVTWYAYLNDQDRVYPAWNSSTDKPQLPMSRQLTEYGTTGRRVCAQVANAANVADFSDPPTGAETWPGQTDFVAMSKAVYNEDEQLTERDVWHDIPSAGDGEQGTHYYKTTYRYTVLNGSNSAPYPTDAKGRSVETRQLVDTAANPDAIQWTMTIYNVTGQVTQVRRTTAETAGEPANYQLVAEYFYGEATPGDGTSLGGRLTCVRQYYGSGNYNQTIFCYNGRSELKLVMNLDGSGAAVPPHTVYGYDEIGRTVAVATYSSHSGLGTSTDPQTTTTNRVSLATTSYDQLGRVYQHTEYSIAADGTKEQTDGRDKKLITRYFYSLGGELVAADPPNGGVAIYQYDGARRQVETWLCSEMEHTASDVYSSGVFDYSNADIKVVEKTLRTLNSRGQATKIESREVNHDDTDGMGASDYVATWTYNWYDDVGRLTTTAYYGTNDNDGWENGSDPSPGSAPSVSGSGVLVTKYTYDSATAQLQKVTDPKGLDTKYEYDDRGRVTRVTEDDGDSSHKNRKTEYAYDGLGNIKTITAKNAVDAAGDGTPYDDEVTEYVRASQVDADWVTKIKYPDPATGAASDATADTVDFTYHLDGAVDTRRDQNQTTITYTYDVLRRLTRQGATALANGVDGTVRSIAYGFNNAGRLETVTSYPNADGSGTAVNQVKFEYDGFGQLLKDYQAHDGAADANSPYAGYSYAHASSTDESSNQNYFDRFQKIRYPNGRYVWYEYAHGTGGIAALNDKLSRIGQIADDNSGSPGKVFAQYDFNGLSRLVQKDHLNTGSGSGGKPGNKTALRFIKQSGASGPTYTGFDRFGRITNLRHVKYVGTTVDALGVSPAVHFNYGYDYNSNRTHAETAHNVAFSHVYAYDNLNRLTDDKLGYYDTTGGTITGEWSVPSEQAWTLDPLGNWEHFDRKHSGSAADETRAHNATNEIKTRTAVAQGPLNWVNDNFSDNDTTNWSVADLDGDGQPNDGTWSAASGKLQCDTVVRVSGAPDGGNGSVLLLPGQYQDIKITTTASLPEGAVNGGIVFGYLDYQNYWVLMASRSSSQSRLYHVSGGTWTLRGSMGWMPASTVTLTAEVRSGSVTGMVVAVIFDYDGTVPAGRVGVWAGSDSATVKFDDYVVRSLAASCVVDGRFTDDVGNVRVNNGKLEFYNSDGTTRRCILRHVRMSTGVVQAKLTWTNIPAGIILNYQDPENFGVAFFDTIGGTVTPRYVEFVDGKKQAVRASGSSFSLTYNQEYGVRTVVTESGGAQTLNVHVDRNQDGDFADNGENVLVNCGDIDGTWSGGQVGLYRDSTSSTATLTWDDFKCGIDNNADGDVDDAGTDYVYADYNFNDPQGSTWQKLTLSHDDDGNLTNDGLFKYQYDAWNRLVKTQRKAAHAGQAQM